MDFVVNDDGFFVLEVNPRFQGSLDTVEHCTGLNVVSAHLKAVCEGELPLKRRRAEEKYAVRLILFAERDCVVEADLRRFCGGNVEKMVEKGVGGGEKGREEGKEERSAGWIADIPQRGRVLRRGEPVASGLGVARSREEAIKKAREEILCVRRNIFKKRCEEWSQHTGIGRN